MKKHMIISPSGALGSGCGTFSVSGATVELTPEELERIIAATWVDVCVPMTEKQP